MVFLKCLIVYLPQIISQGNSTIQNSNKNLTAQNDWLTIQREQFYKTKAEKIAFDFETAYSDPTSENCQKAMADQITFIYESRNLTFQRDGYVTDVAKFTRRLAETDRQIGQIEIKDYVWDKNQLVVKYNIIGKRKRNMTIKAKAEKGSDILKVYCVEEQLIRNK